MSVLLQALVAKLAAIFAVFVTQGGLPRSAAELCLASGGTGGSLTDNRGAIQGNPSSTPTEQAAQAAGAGLGSIPGALGCTGFGNEGCEADTTRLPLHADSLPLYYEQTSARVFNPRGEYLMYVESEYNFAVVADLDLMSRDPHEFIWRSYLKKGRVVRTSLRGERDRFELAWDEELTLTSMTATKNRSMELSELLRYDRFLFAFCDYSGIVYKIDPTTGQTFQRWAIADGNGDETKPFKAEWATVKDNAIWLGSIGFEWYGRDGKLLHRNAEWIKTIDNKGLVRNLNWHAVYQTIRTATSTANPGFMWHEAVEWEPTQRLWVMLPRFASNSSFYVPGTEATQTSDLLLVANEGFTDIRVTRLRNHDARFGFTSVRRLPGSRSLFMILRVHEDGSNHRSQAAIIDLNGEFYTDPPYQEVGERKFEGLEFL